MGIIRNTLKKEINTANKTQFNDATATILDFDQITNTAEIKYRNPNGEGMLYRQRVHIAETLGGITGSGIVIGDTCSITFVNNNVFAPIITGILSSHYSDKTNNDQGGYLTDISLVNSVLPSKIIPMIDNWIDDTNTIENKYNNDIASYEDIDVKQETHNLISTLDKYSIDEQGITNLKTKANVKLKDNGDIDIFIDNNIGIRICAEDDSVNIFGQLRINGEDYKPCYCKHDTGNLPPVENTNNDDIIKDIDKLFRQMDGDLSELKKCINILIILNGDDGQYAELRSKIASFESMKSEFNYNQQHYTSSQLDDIYDKATDLYKYFTEELELGRKILKGEL